MAGCDRTRALLALAGAALALAGLQARELELATPAPLEGDTPVLLERLEGQDCGACHAEVSAEWARTLHAFAWIDPLYQGALEKTRRKESCHGCHIPQPLHARGIDALPRRPAPREEDLHLGISCASCHEGTDGAQLGPRGTPTDAHPTARAATMVGAGSNALCISCHATPIGPVVGIAKDFEEARLGEQGFTCVGCHMAPVERRWANPPPGAEDAEPAPLRVGRSHLLQTPRDPGFLAQAFEVTVARTAAGARLKLANRAGHRIPGLIDRSIAFEARLLDESGKELDRGRLAIDERAYLPLGGTLTVDLAGAGARVALRGVHSDPRLGRDVPFVERGLALD